MAEKDESCGVPKCPKSEALNFTKYLSSMGFVRIYIANFQVLKNKMNWLSLWHLQDPTTATMVKHPPPCIKPRQRNPFLEAGARSCFSSGGTSSDGEDKSPHTLLAILQDRYHHFSEFQIRFQKCFYSPAIFNNVFFVAIKVLIPAYVFGFFYTWRAISIIYFIAMLNVPLRMALLQECRQWISILYTTTADF